MILNGINSLSETIPQFYAGRSIFITGGTGFVGKVLVEKLLRSCPDIKEIFLLMRPKKNLAIDERLKLMLELPLFDRVKKERPGFEEKLIPILGNTVEEGLALGPLERQFIQERVSIIFHVAANVRFDDSLKQAVFSNTRSTRDVCILAHGMKKLVALVHVSSTYAHSDKPKVDEIIYPPLTDWRKIITIVENLGEDILRPMTAKVLGCMPNTYTFTKRLAEQVVADYSKDLPIVLCRPSIVITTLHEPMPGWIDNFNGPVGLLVGGGKGVLRVTLAEPQAAPDYIPVDVTVKIMLVAAYRRGLETVTQNPEPLVCHTTSQAVTRLTIREMIYKALALGRTEPVEDLIWYPQVFITRYHFLYHIYAYILHVIPAVIVDRLLILYGKKPLLMRLQRKIYISNYTLAFFTMNSWLFDMEVGFKLLQDLLPVDVETFGVDFSDFNRDKYLQASLSGGKRYVLKQNPPVSDKAMRQCKRMWWIDRIFKVWLLLVLGWILHLFGTFIYMKDVIQSIFDGSILNTL